MEKILDVQNLHVSYGKVKALRGIDFHIYPGEIVALIGANGAGKTSTLMAISNLISGKKTGQITFDGKDISNTRPNKIVKAGIGHVPEGRHIFPKLSVQENLLMGTFGALKFDRKKTDERLEEIYEMFPILFERKNQLGGTLSGGQQQMLAIGRGLIFSPKLLVLDEPSLGLAPLVVQDIFQHIVTISEQGITVLLVEQNATAALHIADRGYVMQSGHVTLTGTGEELLGDKMVIESYLGM